MEIDKAKLVKPIDPTLALHILTLLIYRAGGKIEITKAEYEAVVAALGNVVPFKIRLADDHHSFTIEIDSDVPTKSFQEKTDTSSRN